MRYIRSNEENVRIRITGLVQGIGFRPHVYRTAAARNITGTVENRTDGVVIHARGAADNLKGFLEDLQNRNPPPAAKIEAITVISEESREFPDFSIIKSSDGGQSVTRISPDLAVCPDCLADMRIQLHRIRYPFINCTNCGPRFSIVTDIPYDRDNTTMVDFDMCETCQAEYTDIHDRRYHAQPVACASCGPSYRLQTAAGILRDTDMIVQFAAERIDSGGIASLMGLGGYHLVCDGTDGEAVKLLRRRKHRDTKPFALMMRDLETIRGFALLDPAEERLLSSPARPIVLLRQNGSRLPAMINDGLKTIGVMLPYLPFHHLLFERSDTRVLVMTSGNRSDEPIVTSPDKAEETLGGIADFIVSHDRRIQNRVDDSVTFVIGDTVHFVRRSRGWVPDPILTDLAVDGIAAFGGELKNTFALGRSDRVVLSQHIGDLENAETLEFFEESYSRFKRLLRFDPRLLVHDRHPDYLSTGYARKAAASLGLPIVAVQHHKAHIASVMVEHRLTTPVIGVCYDGAGYGDDGTIWGGEIFTGELAGFRREIHLESVELPGGDLAARQPWRMALSYLRHAYGGDCRSLSLPFFDLLDRTEGPLAADQVLYMLERNLNSPLSSSMGRLFDGASALIGICLVNQYEGEAPMRLEAAADPGEEGHYPYAVNEDRIDIRMVVTGIVEDILGGETAGRIAARFMNTIVRFTCDAVSRVHENTGIGTVALSGGVFQNRIILGGCQEQLGLRGLTVYTNARVPANDGGLALGQIGMAAVL